METALILQLATGIPVQFDETNHVRRKKAIHDEVWSSPVVRGHQIWLTTGRVYVRFGAYGTACLDTKSGRKPCERRDLKCDHRVRPASSPVVDAQFVVSPDKHTGETLWLRPRGVQQDFEAALKAAGFSDTWDGT